MLTKGSIVNSYNYLIFINRKVLLIMVLYVVFSAENI